MRPNLKYVIAIILTVQFGAFLLPDKSDLKKIYGKFDKGGQLTTKTEQGDVCPNGYAIKIPFGEPNAGEYITCENYDEYYIALSQNDQGRAEKLLLTSRSKAYDKRHIANE